MTTMEPRRKPTTEAAKASVKEARPLRARPQPTKIPGRTSYFAGLVWDAITGVTHIDKVLALKESDALRIARYGLTLLSKGGSLDEAQACATLATRFAPTSFDAWYLLGLVAGQKGQAEIGILAYEQALKIKPGHARAWVDLGELCLTKLQFKRAHDALACALELDPQAHTVAGKRAQFLIVDTLIKLGEG